jgi:hypothetical protein
MRKTLLLTFSATAFLGGAIAAPITDSQREFFESRIRPILAQECYECHSEATKAKGGLLLDSAPGWQKGGESGPVIEPGKPEDSRLLQSISHEIEDLKMPKAGAKLDSQVIADFSQWIAMGAPDPRETAPTPEEVGKDTDWKAISARRAQWWSFLPVNRPEIPEQSNGRNPVDYFIRKKLDEEDLAPAARAEARTLVRRIYFNLIGLPPATEETSSFLSEWEKSPDKAASDLVDRLLSDPRFGEKWARHWMDWTRYAETHGSEGDPVIPHAYRYRDYLIRALNADVGYDQLVLEHFAGDLLEKPRINPELALNESALGLGHLRMVFHGFAPTDALDERVRFTDDQINTATKAFLGLTVSCARCHNHKFDAISQADYYALFGIFSSSLPATIAVDAPGVLERNREELANLKPEIRRGLAELWLSFLTEPGEAWEKIPRAPETSGAAYKLLTRLRQADDTSIPVLWKESVRKPVEFASIHRWNLSDAEHFQTWSRYGEGLLDTAPAPPGNFTLTDIENKGEKVVTGILPSGVFSHRISTRHRGVLASAPFDLDDEYDLYVLAAGEGSSVRYTVQQYPRSGTVYPVTNLGSDRWKWIPYNRIDYWKGDRIHLELATAPDAPILASSAERSWFGIRDAVLVKKGSPGPENPSNESLTLFASDPVPQSRREALALYAGTLRRIVSEWGSNSGELDDASALFLDDLLGTGLLPNSLTALPASLQEKIQLYRKLESEIPLPTRAPGVFERPGVDQPLFVRGDHKQPGPAVPRRYLEAFDATPYETKGTGRLEFARDLVDEENPFTSRVLVNRIWHHLFGEGLVPTVDNFGRLGEMPTHPELLDYLADRLRKEQHWSIKSLIRELVLSDTWQQASGLSPEAESKDPANRFLSSFPIRRLESEAIRDAILSVSGQLDPHQFGASVSAATPRRSIYLNVRRNSLDPLMTTFDFPVPASAVGKRDATNVPGQSLTLLNDPFIMDQAGKWAKTAAATLPASADEETRIRNLFEAALTRSPSSGEIAGAQEFLAALDEEHQRSSKQLTDLSLKLKTQLAKRNSLIDPVRAKLESERLSTFETENGASPEKVDLHPVAHWNLQNGRIDSIGGLPLTLQGTATIEEGVLVLDGSGFAMSDPLPFDLREKSLAVSVQLSSPDQAGGGVITVQDLSGTNFDSIVYAERRPGEWLAGSNNHKRTLDFNAPADEEAATKLVQLVMTYSEDGTIRCYRNGTPWGEPIRKADLESFPKDASRLLLGLRHGTAVSGNKPLRGRIFEAGLYDRALSEGEVSAAFKGGPVPVSRKDIDAVLTQEQSDEVMSLEARIEALEAEAKSLRKPGSETPPEERRWQDLAHAIFNLKEFIYLR